MMLLKSHQHTNNVMERYNREFNNLFDSPKPGLFVFCERVREEATRWERTHEDALKGKFRHRQKRSEVAWPEIPADFDEWTPPKKEKNSGKMIEQRVCYLRKKGMFMTLLCT